MCCRGDGGMAVIPRHGRVDPRAASTAEHEPAAMKGRAKPSGPCDHGNASVLVILAALLLAQPASARTFSFHAPAYSIDVPGAQYVCADASGRKRICYGFTTPARVVEVRAWVTNLTPGRPGYGVRQEFWNARKFAWAPWTAELDGRFYRITPPAKYAPLGDSLELRLKCKGKNGRWGDWTTFTWRER